MVNVTRSGTFGEPAHVHAEAAALRRTNGGRGPINTASIKRDNLTLRQELRRLARKPLGVSKKRRELQHALDFIDAHANFVTPHQRLREQASPDSGRRWVPRTPAMAARCTDHHWTLEALRCFKPYISILLKGQYPTLVSVCIERLTGLVQTVAEQGMMGDAKFFRQSKHVHQFDGEITQAQRHSNQPQVAEKSSGNEQQRPQIAQTTPGTPETPASADRVRTGGSPARNTC